MASAMFAGKLVVGFYPSSKGPQVKFYYKLQITNLSNMNLSYVHLNLLVSPDNIITTSIIKRVIRRSQSNTMVND